ncbi:MAG: SHOCT domain-containing protein [Candidatus Weimeria sp.]
MDVTKITEQFNTEARPITDEDMRAEYRYLLARELTEKLLQEGLISQEEFDRIMEKNRESFSPRSAGIDANELDK